MRKCLFTVLAMVCLSQLAFGQSKDVYGWNKARWGMTDSQVLKVLEGKATRLPNPKSAFGLKEKKDAHASIEIKMLDIQNDKYRALFIFDDVTNKLIKVSLEASEKNPPEVQFTRLEQVLTEKYGTPSYKNDDRTPDKRLRSGVVLGGSDKLARAWNFPSTVIYLEYGLIRLDTPISYIRIDYRQNIKDTLDNL